VNSGKKQICLPYSKLLFGIRSCMKMAVFWVVAQCSLVESHRPDDGGSKDL
jgi:hypothetical protein